MLSCSEVMVASDAPDFMDALADALHEAGAVVICVEDVESAMQAVEDGFRPDAVVVDSTLGCAETFVAWVRERP